MAPVLDPKSCERRYDLRQDETITIDPIRVLGVEAHEFVKHDVGNRCHTHGGSGMTGISFEGGIDLCEEEFISISSSVYDLWMR